MFYMEKYMYVYYRVTLKMSSFNPNFHTMIKPTAKIVIISTEIYRLRLLQSHKEFTTVTAVFWQYYIWYIKQSTKNNVGIYLSIKIDKYHLGRNYERRNIESNFLKQIKKLVYFTEIKRDY